MAKEPTPITFEPAYIDVVKTKKYRQAMNEPNEHIPQDNHKYHLLYNTFIGSQEWLIALAFVIFTLHKDVSKRRFDSFTLIFTNI